MAATKARIPSDSVWLNLNINSQEYSVAVARGTNLLDALKQLPLDIKLNSCDYGTWVTSINGIGEGARGSEKEGFGWQFYINGGLPFISSGDETLFLKLDNIVLDKDLNVEWKYEYAVADIDKANASSFGFCVSLDQRNTDFVKVSEFQLETGKNESGLGKQKIPSHVYEDKVTLSLDGYKAAMTEDKSAVLMVSEANMAPEKLATFESLRQGPGLEGTEMQMPEQAMQKFQDKQTGLENPVLGAGEERMRDNLFQELPRASEAGLSASAREQQASGVFQELALRKEATAPTQGFGFGLFPALFVGGSEGSTRLSAINAVSERSKQLYVASNKLSGVKALSFEETEIIQLLDFNESGLLDVEGSRKSIRKRVSSLSKTRERLESEISVVKIKLKKKQQELAALMVKLEKEQKVQEKLKKFKKTAAKTRKAVEKKIRRLKKAVKEKQKEIEELKAELTEKVKELSLTREKLGRLKEFLDVKLKELASLSPVAVAKVRKGLGVLNAARNWLVINLLLLQPKLFGRCSGRGLMGLLARLFNKVLRVVQA